MEVARQQRRRIAHDEGRQQIDQRIHQLLHRHAAVRLAQGLEIGQPHHHHDAVRAFVFQLSGQLVIEEQAIIQPGFGVLRGKGADQRIDPAALFPRFRQIGQQAVERAADVGRPLTHVTLHDVFAFAVQNAPRAAFQTIFAVGLLTQPAQAEQQNHHHHDDRQRDGGGGLQRAHIAGEGIAVGDAQRAARMLQQGTRDLTIAVQRIPVLFFLRRQLIVEQLAATGLYVDRHDAERAHDDRQPFFLLLRRLAQHGLIESGDQRIQAALLAILGNVKEAV